MTVTMNPYVNLRGTARAAMDFYQGVFGGELTRTTFGEAGMVPDGADPSAAELVMHSQLVTPGGMTLMVSDTPDPTATTGGGGIQISLSGPAEDADDLRRWFDALAGTGTVTLPLEQAPWGDYFGMCQDGWGVDWMVNIAGATA